MTKHHSGIIPQGTGNPIQVDSPKLIKRDNDLIQCHFISNTHWDREWRFSMQRTRYMLVYMMDMLLDILEKHPEYRSFHLDSQMIPLQDYLEIRPEKEAQIKKYIQEDRICVGPWFCLPDEFCVSGESLVRNLLLGHKVATKFGKVSKTGYSPFSWGQISQMPQIYSNFGIPFSAFYRGINALVAPGSEIFWEGADGTRIVASRLGNRPRYNVWYVLQRPAYWNEQDVENRQVSWDNGHGAFKLIDPQYHLLDAQYAHPNFSYYKNVVRERALQAIDEQNNDWTTRHRFWSCGHDSSCPDIREIDLITDANTALTGRAEVFHSSFIEFQEKVCEDVSQSLPVVTGEMRHLYTEGSTSPLFGWVISARPDVKKDNFVTERDLISYAEPLSVFARMLGMPYPQGFLDTAYHWLLQNHGHDSIGGCSREIVSQDMFFRSRQSREISACLTESALREIAGSIQMDPKMSGSVALMVYNPTPFERTELSEAYIQVPSSWELPTIAIEDEAGKTIPFHILEKNERFHQIIQSPNDCANMFEMKRFRVIAHFPCVPGMGYRTFFVKPGTTERPVRPRTCVTPPQIMENEYLSVKVESNGTFTLYHKETGKIYKNLGYFKDSSETGNPWQHECVTNDSVYTTLNENAEITLIRDNELETAYQVRLNWHLPEGRTLDDTQRSSLLKSYPITTVATLRRGEPWLEIETEIDNTVEDHYLRVCFPSRIETNKVSVQGQFDVVERSLQKTRDFQYDEAPQTEQPMNSFVDISDGQDGLALLNEGMKAYEFQDDPEYTINLTLLRCFPLRICVTQEMTDYSQIDKSSQCLGKHTFRYGIMPHAGNWEAGKVWQCSERFNLPFRIGQIAPTNHGLEPMVKSFIEIRDEYLHVSAVKRGEDGSGWIVRLFNPFSQTIKTEVRLNLGRSHPKQTVSPIERVKNEFRQSFQKTSRWSKVREVTLEEISTSDLSLSQEGWVGVEVKPKKILTLEFLA